MASKNGKKPPNRQGQPKRRPQGQSSKQMRIRSEADKKIRRFEPGDYHNQNRHRQYYDQNTYYQYQTNYQRTSTNPKPPSAKKPRRVKKGSYKIITVFTFLGLLIYMCGYLYAFSQKPSIPFESVSYGTIESPAQLRGIAIRDEEVVFSTKEGQPVYYYAENERVKKGAVICNVRNSQNADRIEEQIQTLDSDILEAQKAREDFSIFKEDITAIENEISNTVASYAYKFTEGNFADVYPFRSSVDTAMGKRNEIWLLENTQSVSELQAERQQYQNQLAENVFAVETANSGILSFRIDELESVLTPDKRDSITKDQIEANVETEYISKASQVSEGSPLFKIVKSNQWYIVSYVPNETASQWEAGESHVLYISVNEEERPLNVKIESMRVGDTETYVVFQTDQSITDFLDVRTFQYRVESSAYEGLKIPNSAIVEKTFLKIPNSCVIENLGEQGVIKRVEGVGDSFTAVKVSRTDEEYTYVLQDFASIKLGDVILNGTGETATEYTISEVYSHQGVFVVNSSIAEFKTIDILAQNADYAIVRATDTQGLQVYDNIVSDAATVNEGDTIF